MEIHFRIIKLMIKRTANSVTEYNLMNNNDEEEIYYFKN